MYDVEVDNTIVTPKYPTSIYYFFDDPSKAERAFWIVTDDNQRFVAVFCADSVIAIFDFEAHTNIESPFTASTIPIDFRRRLRL